MSIGLGSDKVRGGGANLNVIAQGHYKVHSRNKWFEVQDLHVTETMPQLIADTSRSVDVVM
eukprot:gene2701-5318_t